jgi:hypothetical protein
MAKQKKASVARFRDAGTGRYVTRGYAGRHLGTTVKEMEKKRGGPRSTQRTTKATTKGS